MAMTSRRELLSDCICRSGWPQQTFLRGQKGKHILSGFLALGPHVRILSPENVMHQFRDELKRVMEGYDE